MSQTEKAELYHELKDAGVTFALHYREYSTEDLQAAVDKLREQQKQQRQEQGDDELEVEPEPAFEMPSPPKRPEPPAPRAQARPNNSMAGEHAYSVPEDTAIRTDASGFVWYREEVKKPAVPQPRARRVLTYLDSGVETKTVSDGRYTETFEVSGKQQTQQQVKITMPSYQVGIYKDPNLPFKIHVYNENRGFDLFEVQKFYGSADLVPPGILRTYVGGDLCYDIRTTIREIEAEYRRIQLQGDQR